LSVQSRSLEGKFAVVTGASQGIGRACALALAEAGANVAIASRNSEKLEAVAKELEPSGVKTLAVGMDVASATSVKEGTGRILAAWGRIEILVNNAGITRDNLLLRMKAEDWDAVLRTNLDGAFHCTQAVLPGMVRQRWGRIVNVCSVVAQSGNAGQANYIASKAGLMGLTRAVAAEVGSRNITVNSVAPGFIDTAMTAGLPDAVKSRILSMVPLNRMGTDRDVALAIRFLVSDDAGYITGHCLNVNGGLFMG
jgi:3-oxoacyl-[acyl-carrier protein] reductase